ncbi:MAG: PorT family protein, partial [Tannerellaceae bacterium]|nr:PorT family protein [Tannerellaceae bacterium]
MKERDEIDDIFRSGLQNWETDTLPGDWEVIAGRLDEGKRIPLRRTLRYWVAAAVVCLALATGSLYWYNQELIEEPIARQLEQQEEQLHRPPRIVTAETVQEVQPAAKTNPATTPVASVGKQAPVTVAEETKKEEVTTTISPD